MNVLLIRPPTHHPIEGEVPEAVRRENVSYPPLGLMAVATHLAKNTAHRVKILDAGLEAMSYPALLRRVAETQSDVVGISAFTHGLLDVVRTVSTVRAAGVRHVLLGGPHVNDFPAEAARLPGVDAVLVGDGEATLPAVLEALNANRGLTDIPGVLTPENALFPLTPARLSEDLNDYPILDRHLIDYGRYYDVLGGGKLFTTLVTSRGCPYRCSFCNTPRDRYCVMSPERVCDELESVLRLGISEVYFVDDTFNITSERVASLCEAIVKRGLRFGWTARFRARGVDRALVKWLKRAGCQRIQFGVEQGTDAALELLQKDVTLAEIKQAFSLCREADIRTVAYFMIGTPAERNQSDVMATLDFSIALEPDFVMYNVLTPFPGTKLYDEGVKKGVVDPSVWQRFLEAPYDGFVPPLWEEHFTAGELHDLLNLAYKRFYFRPKVIMSSLRRLTSARELSRKAKAAASLLLAR